MHILPNIRALELYFLFSFVLLCVCVCVCTCVCVCARAYITKALPLMFSMAFVHYLVLGPLDFLKDESEEYPVLKGDFFPNTYFLKKVGGQSGR